MLFPVLTVAFVFQKKQKNNADDEDTSSLPKVKPRYKDVDEYISTYEPLIFEEAKSQIIKENDGEEGIVFLIITTSCPKYKT